MKKNSAKCADVVVNVDVVGIDDDDTDVAIVVVVVDDDDADVVAVVAETWTGCCWFI